MHDLQYNGGKQLHAAMGLTAACVHKSALYYRTVHISLWYTQISIYIEIYFVSNLFVLFGIEELSEK